MFKYIVVNSNFRHLLIARLINNLGSTFSYMLFIVLSYANTHSMGATMGVMLASTTGSLLMGSIAGVIVDKKQPLQVMVISYIISGALIATVVWLPQSMVVYYIAAFLLAITGSFSGSASGKYRTLIVESDHRLEANSLIQIADETEKIIGPALAVFVLSMLPNHAHRFGFLIDGCSYILAAWLLAGFMWNQVIRSSKSALNPTKRDTQGAKQKNAFWRAWKQGFQPFRDPSISAVFIMFAFILLAITGTDVTYTAYISKIGYPPIDVGYVFAALSAGLISATFVLKRASNHLSLGLKLGGATFGIGLLYAGTGMLRLIGIIMLTNFVLGLLNSAYNVYASTFWQNTVPVEQQGRFFGLVSSIVSAISVVALFTNGSLGTIFGPRFVILLGGALMAVSGFVSIFVISFGESRKRKRFITSATEELVAK